jgi:hypothetical protein
MKASNSNRGGPDGIRTPGFGTCFFRRNGFHSAVMSGLQHKNATVRIET